jgi:hypothetical protein
MSSSPHTSAAAGAAGTAPSSPFLAPLSPDSAALSGDDQKWLAYDWAAEFELQSLALKVLRETLYVAVLCCAVLRVSEM